MVADDDSFDELLRSVAHAPAVSIAELDLAGRRLGRFRVRSRLGAGGMGVVYEAWDERLSRVVALKVLRATHMRSDAHRARLQEEARRAAAVSHPAIATVFDVDEHDGIGFIALELVAGESLRAVLDRGALPVDRTLEILQRIADGLACAHAAGIVHRDLKPENVMIAAAGGVKLLDFGLAILAGPSDGSAAGLQRVGTTGYMAPEQGGGPADARADVYSFGVLAREMLAAAPRSEARARVARALAALAEACASIDPSSRPHDGRALVERLDALSRPAAGARGRGARAAFIATLAASAIALASGRIHVELDGGDGRAAPSKTERAADDESHAASTPGLSPRAVSWPDGHSSHPSSAVEIPESSHEPFAAGATGVPIDVSGEPALEPSLAAGSAPMDSPGRGASPSGLPVTLRVERSGKVVATVDLGPLRAGSRRLALPAPAGGALDPNAEPEAEAEVYVEQDGEGAVVRLAIRLAPGAAPGDDTSGVVRGRDSGDGASNPDLDAGTGMHLGGPTGVAVVAAAIDPAGAQMWNVALCAAELPESLSIALDAHGRFVLSAVGSDEANAFALLEADGEIAELGSGVSACATNAGDSLPLAD